MCKSSRYYTCEDLEGEFTVDIYCGHLVPSEEDLELKLGHFELRRLQGAEVATWELCSHLR